MTADEKADTPPFEIALLGHGRLDINNTEKRPCSSRQRLKFHDEAVQVKYEGYRVSLVVGLSVICWSVARNMLRRSPSFDILKIIFQTVVSWPVWTRNEAGL